MARDDEAREDDDAAQHAVAATPSTTADERAATLPFVATQPAMRDGTAGRDDGAATAASATDTRAPAA